MNLSSLQSIPFPLMLVAFAAIAFVQNMAFTWVSRSRNGGDIAHHRKAAYCSNGIWFFTQVLLFGQLSQALQTGAWWRILIVGLVYMAATTEGSVVMMRRLLRTETGKRRVGSY
jgi:hypothetical protein